MQYVQSRACPEVAHRVINGGGLTTGAMAHTVWLDIRCQWPLQLGNGRSSQQRRHMQEMLHGRIKYRRHARQSVLGGVSGTRWVVSLVHRTHQHWAYILRALHPTLGSAGAARASSVGSPELDRARHTALQQQRLVSHRSRPACCRRNGGNVKINRLTANIC